MDNLSKLLFNMHVSQTAQEISPFKQSVDYDYTKFNIEKFNHINQNENNLNNFAKICLDEFNLKYSDLQKGSLHINYVSLTKFSLNSIINKYNSNNNTIFFENGCCSNDNCLINLYYVIVFNNVMWND